MSRVEHVRRGYAAHGVRGYYQAVQDGTRDYRNPHEDRLIEALESAVAAWGLDLSRVLDLCAGGGEVTRVVRRLNPAAAIDATDPYTHALYEKQVGLPCLPHSFADIAAGALAGRSYALIVCSYALHLASPSVLPAVEIALSFLAPRLLTLSPNHRPVLKHNWRLEREDVVQRVKMKLYASDVAGPPPE